MSDIRKPGEQEETQEQWAARVLSECEQEKFYGVLTFKLEHGKIVLAERLEKLKPPRRS